MFVQDVIAAINIDPSLISYSDPSILEIIGDFLLVTLSNTFLKFEDASVRRTLSWGLLGPEIVGTTFDKSKESVSVNSISLLDHKPCSFE